MSIIKVIALPLVLFCAYGGFEAYQVHSKNSEFDVRIQGMSQYEVCQVAYEEFGIDMAKEVGCLDNIETISDIGE